MKLEIRAFLTSALEVGECSASRLGLLAPGRELPLPTG